MSDQVLDLEDFGGPGSALAPKKEVSKDYVTGYEEGRMVALQEAAEDQLSLRHTLVATLEDLSFTQAAARAQLLSGLEGLFTQISVQLIPRVAQETFGQHLQEALTRFAENSLNEPLVLRCAPASVLSIQAVLEHADGVQVSVLPDQTLAAHQVIFSSQTSEALLDISALVEALQNALRGLNIKQRSQDYG